jgi:imidazolonepropionase-like amidohydrolase
MLKLTGGRVADVDGTREADVGIEDGRIVAVGSVGDADEVVDVSGQYVAPGLVDAHVHLFMDGRPNAESMQRDSTATASYRAAANLRTALDAGVTAVRDLGAPGGVALDARAAVEAGVLPGPRVAACGQNITMTGGHGHWIGVEADGPEEVRKAAREQVKNGADVVKCMATGGVLTTGAKTGSPELTQAELEALVDAASAKDVPTSAHAHGERGIQNAVRAGITSIEHGTFMDRETAELMVEHGTYWVPTASALHGIVENGVEAGIPEQAVAKAEDATDRFAAAFEHALDAGVSIAMGTDAGTPFNFFEDIPSELELMVEYGMSPADALESATVTSAELLGIEDVGRVSVGYRADLVVLDDDPNADPAAWQNPQRVLVDGEFHR